MDSADIYRSKIKPQREQALVTLSNQFEDILAANLKRKALQLLKLEGCLRVQMRSCADDTSAARTLKQIECVLEDTKQRLRVMSSSAR